MLLPKMIVIGLTAYMFIAVANAKLDKIDSSKAFVEANTTKDAGITPAELSAYLQKHGHSNIKDKEAKRLVRAVDVDNNNSLSQEEFIRLINYRNEFVELDESGDLKLNTSTELDKYLGKAGYSADDIKALISELDKNHDGFLDLNEFVSLATIVDDFKTTAAGKKVIGETELTAYLTKRHAKLDGNDVKRLIIATDDNHDGKIDINEFGKIFLIYDEFSFYNKNNDGELTKSELDTYLKATTLYISGENLQRLMLVSDADKNGTLDFDEFAFVYVARKAFRNADRIGDGELDKEDVKRFFSDVHFKITDSNLDAVIQLVDNDGNGKLDFDEFVELLMSYKLFTAFNTKKTGFLGWDEWVASPHILGSGATDLKTLKEHFGFADINGDKMISYPEFVKSYIDFKNGNLGKK